MTVRFTWINDEGYVYRMEEGKTYDGGLIEAYWKNTLNRHKQKSGKKKKVKEVYLRAEGDTLLFTTAGSTERMPIPDDVMEIIPSADETRTIQFTIANEAGGWFSILGGIDIFMEVRDRK